MLNKLIKVLKLLTLLGFLGFFFHKHFFFFFASYSLAVILGIFKKIFNKEEDVKYSSYYKTVYLSLLNPFFLINIFKQLAGQLYLFIKVSTNKKSVMSLSGINYRLPFENRWKIVNGGITKETSHSWDLYGQRYAYDFCIFDENDKPNKDTGTSLDDYYCYDKPVSSPADGMVVEIKDSIKDYTHLGDLSLDWKAKDFRGNFVIIQHADAEYSFTAHLKYKSVLVKVGEKVRQGQIIAYCGNSGHSTMPHIHFQIQNKKSFWFAMGIPVYFKNIQINYESESNGVKTISVNELVTNLK